MNTTNKNSENSKPDKNEKSRFANTQRDEATLGTHKDRESDSKLADENQPTWQPPESQPEPRPADPIMNSSQQSNQNTNTNSPA